MAALFNFIVGIIELVFFLAVVVAVIAFFGYNKLRSLAEGVKEAESNIGVTVNKKISLINQLIDIAKSFQNNEDLVLLKISSDMSLANLSAVQQQSSMALATVASMGDRYPDMKSNQNYQRLIDSVQKVEDQIESQRQRYNAAAKIYNIQRTSIPHVFYSKVIGFGGAPYLDFQSSEPQDGGMLKSFGGDDGERLNALLSSAGSRALHVGKDMGALAVGHGKQLLGSAQVKLALMRTVEFTYLDAAKNPQGPVTMDELKLLFAQSQITEDTPVLQAGGGQWSTFQSVTSETVKSV